MSVLSDNEIIERINEIFPDHRISNERIQPASVDLRLHPQLKTISGVEHYLEDNPFILPPNGFILGCTVEKVHIPNDLVGIVNGKSSLARKGLMVHVTAGYIDSGFRGNITLELFNVSQEPVFLEKHMDICQLVLEELTSPVYRPYGSEGLNSHYQDSNGTVLSRFLDF